MGVRRPRRAVGVVLSVAAVAVAAGAAALLWSGSGAGDAPAPRTTLVPAPVDAGAVMPGEMSDEEAIAELESQADVHDPLQDPLRDPEDPESQSSGAVTTADTVINGD
jgi:hypothetical protein